MKFYLTQYKSSREAFSLIEVLVVLSVLVFLSLSVVGLLSAGGFSTLCPKLARLSLERARGRAAHFVRGTSWGVKFFEQENRAVVFSGESFLGRVSEFDEEVKFFSEISISGLEEVVFAAGSGDAFTLPLEGRLFLRQFGRTIQIMVSDLGVID